MKKILLLFLLVLVSVTASARKSYITIDTRHTDGKAQTSNDPTNVIILTGDVPDNIEGFQYNSKSHFWSNNPNIRKYSTGEILNLLSEYGYEVEYVHANLYFLLSKEIPSSGQIVNKGDVDKDGEVNNLM